MSCGLGSRWAEGEISDRRFFENKAGSPVGWDWTAASPPALAVTGGVISLQECDNYGEHRHLTKKPFKILFSREPETLSERYGYVFRLDWRESVLACPWGANAGVGNLIS